MNDSSPIPPIDIWADQWQIVRGILEQHVPGFEVWAFGSRARRTAAPYSDLDLAIMAQNPLDQDIIGAMKEAFVESDLPWKVDILDWATASDGFRDIIKADRILLLPRIRS